MLLSCAVVCVCVCVLCVCICVVCLCAVCVCVCVVCVCLCLWCVCVCGVCGVGVVCVCACVPVCVYITYDLLNSAATLCHANRLLGHYVNITGMVITPYLSENLR